MRTSVLLMALALLGAACGNDAGAICDKLDECNLLIGRSVEQCEDDLERESDGRVADCADCVADKECSSIINGACQAECSTE